MRRDKAHQVLEAAVINMQVLFFTYISNHVFHVLQLSGIGSSHRQSNLGGSRGVKNLAFR
jgi:hypothetical protein